MSDDHITPTEDRMMADDIPEWATREACKRLGENYDAFVKGHLSVFVGRAIRVCAQLIAAHEEPPVDPLLIEARELCAARGHPIIPAVQFTNGYRDEEWMMEIALAALKRGMELAREQGESDEQRKQGDAGAG